VLLTLGLLSPNKGIERVIEALPRIVAKHPDVLYLIVGATHPHIRQCEGDRYQLQLQTMAQALGVERNVSFHNRFVSPEEMADFVGAADIYITPYPYEAQAVSGHWLMPWAPAKRLSRRHIGMLSNCLAADAEFLSLSKIQAQSRSLQSGSSTTTLHVTPCETRLPVCPRHGLGQSCRVVYGQLRPRTHHSDYQLCIPGSRIRASTWFTALGSIQSMPALSELKRLPSESGAPQRITPQLTGNRSELRIRTERGTA